MQKPACGLLGALALIGGSTPVQGQGLQLEPVSLAFQPGQMAAILMVTNKAAAEVAVQARPFRWSQAGGEDLLAPTDQLAVSPPITRIPPGQTQTFRLVLRQPPAGTEGSFRVLLDELPAPTAGGAVRIALRMSVPVFATVPGQQPVLTWRVGQDARGAYLSALNSGGGHVRIINPQLTTASGVRVAGATGQLPYVLPHSERIWRLDHQAPLSPGMRLRLAALSDAGPITATVRVDDK